MDFSNNDCEKIIDSKLNGNVFYFDVVISSVRSSSGYHGLLEIRQRSSSSHFFRFFKFFRF